MHRNSFEKHSLRLEPRLVQTCLRATAESVVIQVLARRAVSISGMSGTKKRGRLDYAGRSSARGLISSARRYNGDASRNALEKTQVCTRRERTEQGIGWLN